MLRIIFKCPYLKPDQHHSGTHREHYVHYIAKRPWTERSGAHGLHRSG